MSSIIAETQEAIDRSFAGLTNEEYLTLRHAVEQAADESYRFSANDVWAFVPAGKEPHNKLALGAVLQRMGREGLIEKSIFTTRSIRTHGSVIGVWKRVRS